MPHRVHAMPRWRVAWAHRRSKSPATQEHLAFGIQGLAVASPAAELAGGVAGTGHVGRLSDGLATHHTKPLWAVEGPGHLALSGPARLRDGHVRTCAAAGFASPIGGARFCIAPAEGCAARFARLIGQGLVPICHGQGLHRPRGRVKRGCLAKASCARAQPGRLPAGGLCGAHSTPCQTSTDRLQACRTYHSPRGLEMAGAGMSFLGHGGHSPWPRL